MLTTRRWISESRAVRWCRRSIAAAIPAALLLALSGCEEDPAADSPYVQRGADIAAGDVFGSPVDAPLDISSTFGPRWKYSESRYDFHRGIDYFGDVGDPIRSIGGGLVTGVYPEGSSQYPNGGNVLVIRYDLDHPFSWQGTTVDRLYAVYLHLDTFQVDMGEDVSEGQIVGRMGESGATEFPHLHFEIRLQTVCSLEFQIANPDEDCAEYGFDPHVHPYAFVGGENADSGLEFQIDDGPPFTVTYRAGRGDLDLNELRTDLGDLNFNRRTGIDASATVELDDFDYGWVTVLPEEFLSDSDEIVYRFEFEEKPKYVELLDLYGYGIRKEF